MKNIELANTVVSLGIGGVVREHGRILHYKIEPGDVLTAKEFVEDWRITGQLVERMFKRFTDTGRPEAKTTIDSECIQETWHATLSSFVDRISYRLSVTLHVTLSNRSISREVSVYCVRSLTDMPVSDADDD